MTDLEYIIKNYNEVKANFRTTIQVGLKDAFTEFFHTYPEFRSVEWTQYTPYFNDGDPCEFRVGEFRYTAQLNWYSPDIAEGIENGDFSNYELDDKQVFELPTDHQRKSQYFREKVTTYDSYTDAQKERAAVLDEAWEEFHSTLTSIPDEIFLASFEDHSRIIVTRDGIEITEYDHD